jgi:aspartyl-tRNA(Asn)/glutamyl-tRNA(Gln) amidotransferase subunit B
MDYEPVIGLEIHVELKTKSKMFCHCPNDSGETHPNFNVCPVCLGHPGTLPTINIEAVRSVLRLALALDAEIPSYSKFDRKSYFYPDLPKGYQLSQYDEPLASGGEIRGIRIRRIHLEEDAGRLQHDKGENTLVDFNRAGVPLMELVTEPDIRSGDEAAAFARELRLVLRYLDISRADMEKGEMRIEANISLRKKGGEFGTKVEIKNLNSFRALKDVIDYEIERQGELLNKGEKVRQETRGWKEDGRTISQRSKEEAHDYRYLPEPDLPPLNLTDAKFFDLNELKLSVPELPEEKRKRFIKEFGLDEAKTEMLIEDRELAQYFEETISEIFADNRMSADSREDRIRLAFNYLTTDLKGIFNNKRTSWLELKISPRSFAELINLIAEGKISSRMAKDILVEMFVKGLTPEEIVANQGIKISGEDEVSRAVGEALAANPAAVADYQKGKESVLQFLVGKVMASLKGRGDPAEIIRQMKEKL